jgi:hypothetical protein
MMDFRVINHGSVWTIRAMSPEARTFARDNFEVEGWQGTPEHLIMDHRPASALVERLISEGWRIT